MVCVREDRVELRPARPPRRRRGGRVPALAVGRRGSLRMEQRRQGDGARAQAKAARSTSNGSRTVLLVDDDDSLRTLYRFNLEASGVSVTEAADGETALRLLGEGELPDVVLLDVMMPGLDGWAVAERIAADARLRRVPIIFITARAEDAARDRGLRLGAVGYLTKPFNPVTLADSIEKILAAGGADG